MTNAAEAHAIGAGVGGTMTMGAQGRPGLRAEWPKPKPKPKLKLQHGMASVLGCHKQFCHGPHAALVLAHGLRGWDRWRRGGSMRPDPGGEAYPCDANSAARCGAVEGSEGMACLWDFL
jgi:hypothetical protein